MRISAMVVFYPVGTQTVDTRKVYGGDLPQVQMSFKSLPEIGHIIEAPNASLPASAFKVALVMHDVHGDIVIKTIPVL